MPSVFTRIIDGELPGRFVWRDDEVVAFLSIDPVHPGHTLVVPRVEVDHWIDLEPRVWQRVSEVAQAVGVAIRDAFDPPRVATAIVGVDVPHTHLHVLQLHSPSDLGFGAAQTDPDPAELDDAAQRLRAALRAAGHDRYVSD